MLTAARDILAETPANVRSVIREVSGFPNEGELDILTEEEAAARSLTAENARAAVLLLRCSTLWPYIVERLTDVAA
jgi:hypothetical protein